MKDRLPHLDWRLVALVAAGLTALVLAMGPATFTGERTFSTVDALESFEPWRSFGTGEATNTAATDPVNAFYPKWDEMRERLGEGDVPLWSSLIGTGSPLITLPQRGVLSPFNAPRWLSGAAVVPALVKLLEALAAAGFTWLFLRRLGLSRVASAIGGIAFVFTGFQVAWQGWQHTQVGALIPAAFWTVERAIQERRVTAMIPVSLAAAALLFGGFPAVALWTLQAAGVYALVRVLTVRERWRDRGRDLGLLAGAVAVGVALTAVQVVPFLEWLSERVTQRRGVWREAHLHWEAVLTTVVPDAFGNPSEKVYYGTSSFIEQQSYVGIGVLGLAAVGTFWRIGTAAVRRGARAFFAVAVVVLGWLVYHGGTALHVASLVPPFGTNYVGRLRVLLGFFLAALAAVGWYAAVERNGRRPARRGAIGLAVVAAGVAVLLAAGIGRADMLAGTEFSDYLDGELLGAGVMALVVAVGAALAALERTRVAGAVVLAGAVVVQGALFAHGYWARPPAEAVYPVTPAHDHVLARAGHDRVALAGRAMEPGTNQYYGYLSVTAHAFQPPGLADLLRAVDEDSFRGNPTFPILSPGPATATSPILDRLGARLYVQSDLAPLLGEHEPLPPAEDVRRLNPGDVVTAAAPSGPATGAAVEGVTVDAARIKAVPGHVTWLRARLLDPGGEELASGRRRLHARIPTGEMDIGLVWDGRQRAAPPGSTLELAVTGDPGWIELSTDAGGILAAGVADADDGLDLGYVGGVHIYERTRALPRIRWASDAVVVTDPAARVERLRAGTSSPEQVVLAEPAPVEPAGAGARLEVRSPVGDLLEVDVEADGAGYLVVADALTGRGWEATVDGEPVPILQADHAGAAVPVAAGAHRVRFVYRPAGLRIGAVVTVAATALLVGVAVTARRRDED